MKNNAKIQPENWVTLYADYLFNYTIARVNNRDLAKDLIQDTFVAALGAAKNFKGNANERTWLTAILKRKIIDYYRKSNSKKGRAETTLDLNDLNNEANWLETHFADSLGNAEDTLKNAELGQAILTCLSKLPPKQAEIFKLKTIEKVNTKMLCNDYKITASNLWTLIHRARKAMVSCLNTNWFNK